MTLFQEDARTYNAEFDKWLPDGARSSELRGDETAKRLMLVFRRFRAFRRDEDWRQFVALRDAFMSGK